MIGVGLLGYVFFRSSILLLCAEMQLTGLCVQVFELSEKVDGSLGLPLTRWPRVRDPDPLSKANANSGIAAT